MVRISLSVLFCGVLALVFASGCTTASTGPAKSGDTVEVLEFESVAFDLSPGVEKEVKVKKGKVESAEAPKDSGLTTKVEGGKLTITATKDAKEGTHEVKVKGTKGDATVKVTVPKKAG